MKKEKAEKIFNERLIIIKFGEPEWKIEKPLAIIGNDFLKQAGNSKLFGEAHYSITDSKGVWFNCRLNKERIIEILIKMTMM